MSFGNGIEFAGDVIPALLIGGPPRFAGGHGIECSGFAGSFFVGVSTDRKGGGDGCDDGDERFTQLEVDELLNASKGDGSVFFH